MHIAFNYGLMRRTPVFCKAWSTKYTLQWSCDTYRFGIEIFIFRGIENEAPLLVYEFQICSHKSNSFAVCGESYYNSATIAHWNMLDIARSNDNFSRMLAAHTHCIISSTVLIHHGTIACALRGRGDSGNGSSPNSIGCILHKNFFIRVPTRLTSMRLHWETKERIGPDDNSCSIFPERWQSGVKAGDG